MSIPEMKRFVADCRTNPDMAREVADAGTDLGAVVGVANRHGYQFTTADATAALAQTRLNEAQLGQVAGGDGVVAVSTNVVTTNLFGTNASTQDSPVVITQVIATIALVC